MVSVKAKQSASYSRELQPHEGFDWKCLESWTINAINAAVQSKYISVDGFNSVIEKISNPRPMIIQHQGFV